MYDPASVSAGYIAAVEREIGSLQLMNIEAADAMLILTSAPIWYWATEDGRPTLRTYTEIRSEWDRAAYLQRRDKNRQEKGARSKVGSSVGALCSRSGQQDITSDQYE